MMAKTDEDRLLEAFDIDLETGAVGGEAAPAPKCKRHDWRLPEVGDEALLCERCRRTMPFFTTPPDLFSSVVNGIHKAHGQSDYRAFRSALYAASEAVSVAVQGPKIDAFNRDKGRATVRDYGAFLRRMETGPVKVGGKMVPLVAPAKGGRYT